MVVASDKASENRGVLVTMNNSVISGKDVVKMNTTEVQAFQPINARVHKVMFMMVKYTITLLQHHALRKLPLMSAN